LPELSCIAATNPTILWESWETLEAWAPALQSLVAEQGSEVTITQAMVNDLNSVLEQIEAVAQPAVALGHPARAECAQPALVRRSHDGCSLGEGQSAAGVGGVSAADQQVKTSGDGFRLSALWYEPAHTGQA
jgi:hypothetical protein